MIKVTPLCLLLAFWIPMAENEPQWPLAQGGHSHLLGRCEDDDEEDAGDEDDGDDDSGWPTNGSMTLGTRCTGSVRFAARIHVHQHRYHRKGSLQPPKCMIFRDVHHHDDKCKDCWLDSEYVCSYPCSYPCPSASFFDMLLCDIFKGSLWIM